MESTEFLEFDTASHTYYNSGRRLPSVTQVLDKAGLINEFSKRDESARERGSRVHELTALDDVKRLDLRTVPKHLKNYLLAWRRFRLDTRFFPTQIEQRVDDLKHGYSGRFDRLGIMPDKKMLTILDIKTGAIQDYVRFQLSAYCLALDPNKVFNRLTVSLMANRRYTTRTEPLATFYSDRAEWLSILGKVKSEEEKESA